MPDKNQVCIIGIAPEGPDNLTPASRRLISQAQLLFGGNRLLEMFPSSTAEKVAITNNLQEVVDIIMTNLGRKAMVVLASGDPTFFGIGKYLTENLGKEAIEIVPNVSAVQMAFARIKENWDDAVLVSVHSRPIEEIIETVRSSRKVAIFTDSKNTPNEIARVLRDEGIENCQVYVCEDLGSEKERIVSTYLDKMDGMEFSPLNTMILVRERHAVEYPEQRLTGIPDDNFLQREGTSLITKLEIRAVSLAKMGLNEHSIVWDIGAGSGAVAIEASLLAKNGRVFAIEKNPGDVSVIQKNTRKFGRHNVKVIQALAPEKLEELPDPTAVFIGGSSGNMTEILNCVCRRLKPGGRIVINIATLENLTQAITGLEANSFASDVTLVNVARSKDILNLTRLEALNPVFIITGRREKEA